MSPVGRAGNVAVSSRRFVAVGSVESQPERAPPRPRVTEQPIFERYLGDDLYRADRQGRELLLVIARPDEGDPLALLRALAGRLRPVDSASIVDARYVGVLLPGLAARESEAFARELSTLGAGRVSVGIATAPHDGIDARTVLAAARAACAAAGPGSVHRARDAIETISAGSQRILVADPAMARLYELAR